MLVAAILLQALLLATTQRPTAAARRDSNWQFPFFSRPASSQASRDLEREATSNQQPPRSPVLIGHQLQASQLFSRNNGRFPQVADLSTLREVDLFQCVDPTRVLYDNFARQYNRTYQDNQDRLERFHLFRVTLKRAIILNRIIQNEILNRTNYEVKPEIRNYHFIEPQNGENLALWYADITDCELGLLKHILFDVFYLIDKNELALAYKFVQEQRAHLGALMSDDGFEQLAEIMLVRLYDRFNGDKKMNQLFEWPMYLKKLAAYAYSLHQAQEPDFKTKLSLVAYAYPAYFKDLKYNFQAINRTNDNREANREHVTFNSRHGRKFKDLSERNRRLAIFRQRWTLVNQLNSDPLDTSGEAANSSSTRHLLPDWLRVQYLPQEEQDTSFEYSSSPNLGSAGNQVESVITSTNYKTSDKLLAAAPDSLDGFESSSQANGGPQTGNRKPFGLTQFSDLTDLEFQAFLSNDFSLLGSNSDSADFLDRNFPVRPLDARLRWEVAHELELRRGTSLTSANLELLQRSGQLGSLSLQQTTTRQQQQQPSLRLAKQVVDELISDVGLPIGPASIETIPEEEHVRMFQKVAAVHQKPYLLSASASGLASELTSSDLADERVKRFDTFKQNHGRFRAWFAKEDWRLSEAQSVAMLKLADLSWLEIKLSLFKVCCLTHENLIALSSVNATIQYLGSNYELMCAHMAPSGSQQNNRLRQPSSRQNLAELQRASSANDLAPLELYYYYSVHFNKHHLDRADFERRFRIFRRNIDAIRRHSCKRSLTLYESLRLKANDLLSTIDVLDPRRSHTDDLNLDRFEYFSLALGGGLSASEFSGPNRARAQQQQDLVSYPPGSSASARLTSAAGGRAGFTHRRDHFAHLLERAHSPQPGASAPLSPADSYANRLLDSWQDANEYAARYQAHRVGNIYELVMARYKFCMKTLKGIDLDSSELRQQCQSNGLLGDQAAQSGLIPDEPAAQQFGRLQSQQAPQDSCAFYRQGLEPWAEGLIRQDELSARLIQAAKC